MSALRPLAAAAHDVVRAARGDAPRVSAIVPTYNTRAYVREAVTSLLAQTFEDFEILIIDDASTDGSTEVLADLGDPRIRIVRHHANQGLSGARNTGIALARGEYIALLDADDVALPRRFERQVALLDSRPRVGVVGTWSDRVDATGRFVAPTPRWRLPDAALAPYLLFNNALTASTLMLRRSALPAHGFRPTFAEDYAMTADVSRVAELAVLRECLVNYRLTPGSIMQSKLDRVAEGALATQRSLLAEAGMDDAEYDFARMKTLMYFGVQRPGAMDVDWLLAIRRWMQRIAALNARSRRYPELALRQASARMWDYLLLEATKLESLRPGWRYASTLWPFRLDRADPSMRARALVHGLLNALPFDARRARGAGVRS